MPSNTGSPLLVAGLTPLSTLDFPDALAAVIFCQGCPWHCRYCHNAPLQAVQTTGKRDWGSIVDWLQTRRGLLDGVVFSGGEPTLQAGLAEAMTTVAALGFRVGLHSAGMFPEALDAALGHCQWLGLDIKAPVAAYDAITGVEGSGRAPWDSLRLAQAADVTLEVRTTWHPDVLREAALRQLTRDLAEAGVTNWVLQGFRPQGCTDAALAGSGPHAPAPELVATLQALAPAMTISVRS